MFPSTVDTLNMPIGRTMGHLSPCQARVIAPLLIAQTARRDT